MSCLFLEANKSEAHLQLPGILVFAKTERTISMTRR